MDEINTEKTGRKYTLALIIGSLTIVVLCMIFLYMIFFQDVKSGLPAGQFTIALNTKSTATDLLKSEGFTKDAFAVNIAFWFRGVKNIPAGGYEISPSMSAWNIAGILSKPPSQKWIVIPEGLRKEEIADLFAKTLGWNTAKENEFLADTQTNPDYFEGVYFPDTYLVPVNETPSDSVKRLEDQFQESFAPYAAGALAQNIKWTTLLKVASIVQREAAGKDDMPLVAGIFWNRLLKNMRLQADSTVQYARGNTGNGWWAPITPSDEQIDSPYNTYKFNGLPPTPISNPGLDAINAALHPATTTCLYYLHDNNGMIHCSDTYAGQLQNVQKYLK